MVDKPTKQSALEAIKTLLRWVDPDADRDGLLDTPERVLRSFEEVLAGYCDDPALILAKTFNEVAGYDEIILLQDIPFISFCEHHLLPFKGRADVAYLPNDRVVGISKIARLVDCYAKRLQIQERMTAQIAQSLQTNLDPRAVAVFVTAEHQCMSCRGVKKDDVKVKTSYFTGLFKTSAEFKDKLFALIRG